MVSPILIIFLQDTLTLPTDQLAWAFLPSGLVWALLPARLGTLADRFGRKQLMVVGLIGAAAVSLLIPSLANWIMLALLWAALALFSAAGDPAEQALVAELTGADHGRAYGVYALMGGLGATIGPLRGRVAVPDAGAEHAVLCQRESSSRFVPWCCGRCWRNRPDAPRTLRISPRIRNRV